MLVQNLKNVLGVTDTSYDSNLEYHVFVNKVINQNQLLYAVISKGIFVKSANIVENL